MNQIKNICQFALKGTVGVILGLFFFSQFSYSQGRVEFETFGREVGLSQVTIFDIVQDEKGFIWFATQDGLNRFDGHEIKVFRNVSDDPNSLSGNFIYDLHIDSKNNLWVGTRTGLSLYNNQSQTFKNFYHQPDNPNSLSGNEIKKIIEDSEGYMWFATAYYGLSRFDTKEKSFTRINEDSPSGKRIKNNNINDLILDQEGNIWIASGTNRLQPSRDNGYLEVLNPKNLDVKNIDIEKSANELQDLISYSALYRDSKDRIWIGTNQGQIYLYEQKQLKEIFTGELKVPRLHNSITTVLEDQNGNFWIGTQLNGLYKVSADLKSLINLNQNNEHFSNLDDKDLTTLFLDRTNVLWIGTWTRGVKKLSPNSLKFNKYLQSSSFSHREGQPVRAITQDSDGTFWLAAWNSGLISLNTKNGETKTNPLLPFSLSGSVREVYAGDSGYLWVGTVDSGLFRIDIKKSEVKNYRFIADNPNSLASNTVMNVIEDNEGNLWIATRGGGLNKLNIKTERITRFLADSSIKGTISDDSVVVIHIEKDGLFWIGTENGGLNIFDPKTNKVIAQYNYSVSPEHIGTNRINDIYEDRKGNFFLATDKGVSRVLIVNGDSRRQKLKFELLGDEEGRAIGPTGGIFDDANGYIWASTISGIFKLSPDGSEIFYFGKQFGVLEKGYYIRSRYRDRSGQVFFGAVNGVTSFNPASISGDPFQPRVAITRLMLFDREVTHLQNDNNILNRSIDETESITLNHLQNAFSIEFSALHFSAPEDIQYAYKLSGFNKDWLQTTARNRRATYTNLDPGDYQFYVKAANPTGLWGEKVTTLNIKVLPAWWKSKIAYFVYIAFAIGLIYYLNRQSRIAEQLDSEKTIAQIEKDYAVKSNELKSKFLANMSHEIRTPMNAIIGLSELALRVEMDVKLSDYLDKIRSSAKSLLRIIDDILDYSKIDADKLELEKRAFQLENVVKEVINVISPKASEKKLELIVSHLEDIDFRLIGDELRLRQVIINLANNAIKFTHEGFVEIRFDILHQGSNHIEIKVSVIDSGIGMSGAQIQKIFQPFIQAEMSTTRKYGGTGLGLALSRHLVNLMGGEVHVSSVKGMGTTFSFNARFGVELTGKSLYFEDKPLLNQLNVLVIEDNQETLVALIRMLESFGIHATPYLASDITAQQLEDSGMDFTQYGLIMLDSSLPTSSFGEIGQYLKKKLEGTNKNTHVLLMTGISTIVDPLHHKIFDTIIEKPVTPSELHDGLLSSLDIRTPVPEDASYSDEEKARLLAKLATKKILVVEDNEINQQVAKELIAAFGVTVDCVNNGMEALDRLENGRYDMVFMDMQMPILDGIETTKIIREKELLNNDEPIVAMTAHAMVGDRERCLAAGMDDYVSKPIKPEILYDCMRNWLLKGEQKRIGSLSSLLQEVSRQEVLKESQILALEAESNNIDKRVLNVSLGIESMDNDKVLYRDIIKMFVDQYGDICRVSELKRRVKPEEQFNFFHTLKGLAATIGAENLHSISKEMETAIKDGIELDMDRYQNFVDSLCKVSEAINQKLEISESE